MTTAQHMTLMYLHLSVGPQQESRGNAFFNTVLLPLVMLYYDYLLTFEGEVRFFWKRKINLVTILFFLTRYTALLGNIPLFLKYFGNWAPSVRMTSLSRFLL